MSAPKKLPAIPKISEQLPEGVPETAINSEGQVDLSRMTGAQALRFLDDQFKALEEKE